jgi:hypothetical protein
MKIINKEDTILPEEEHHSICIIRCSHDNVINLPKRLLDDIGWKINQKVVWSMAEHYKDSKVYKTNVEIDTLEDIEREYYPVDFLYKKETKC